MTQYQPPQGQYTPPPVGGAYVPPTGYGAPGAAPPQSAMPPAEVKWSGLATGGAYKIPVIGFIGRLAEVIKDSSSPHGLRIIEKYDQVQILSCPVPWPLATVEFSIPYKDRENSGWGHHVLSAKALGLATQAVSLDQALAELVGKTYEMQQTEQSYGEDRNTGNAMKGDVWRFIRIVGQSGQVPAFPQPQYAVPPQAPQNITSAPHKLVFHNGI